MRFTPLERPVGKWAWAVCHQKFCPEPLQYAAQMSGLLSLLHFPPSKCSELVRLIKCLLPSPFSMLISDDGHVFSLASNVFLLTADNHGNSTVCSQASQTMQFIMTQCRNCYYTPRMVFLLFLIEYLIYDYVHTCHLAIIFSTLCESS